MIRWTSLYSGTYNFSDMRPQLPFLASGLALFVAFFVFLVQGNNEFIFYVVPLAALVFVLSLADRSFHFLWEAKWGFFIWMLMHLFGGALRISDGVLYNVVLVPLVGEPYGIFRFDQLTHFFCYVVVTLLFYSILLRLAAPKRHTFLFVLVLLLCANAIGVVNELIEFTAVVLLQNTGVGGYHNTLLDMVFNLIGSLTGIAYLKLKQF